MRCTSCDRVLELAHAWPGSKTICPYCHAVVPVPDPASGKPAGPGGARVAARLVIGLLLVLLLLAVGGLLIRSWPF